MVLPHIIDLWEQPDRLPLVVASIAERFRKRTLLPFFGAGFSRDHPSNNLLIAHIRPPLVDLISSAVTNSYLPETIFSKVPTSREVADALAKEPFEKIIDVLYALQPDAVNEYMSALDKTDPNINHHVLASIASLGMIPFAATVNFDTLFERALSKKKVRYRSYVPLLENLSKTNDSKTVLLKLHGSFNYEHDSEQQPRGSYARLLPALSQIGNSPSIRNVRALHPILSCCDSVLVIGYGQRDWDVWPIIDRYQSRIRNLYWVFHERPESVESLRNMLPSWASDGKHNTYAIIGKSGHILSAVSEQLRVPVKEGDRDPSTEVPSTKMFASSVRTMISSIKILPEEVRGDSKSAYRTVTRYLLRSNPVDRTALSFCQSQLAWLEYATWNFPGALYRNTLSLHHNRLDQDIDRSELRFRTNRALLTRGYIHLGILKDLLRTLRSHKFSSHLAIFWSILLIFIRTVIYYSALWLNPLAYRHSRTYSRLQWTSLLQQIGLHFSGRSQRLRWLGNLLLRVTSHQYKEALKNADQTRSQAFLDYEYFEMRAIEAHLLTTAKPTQISGYVKRLRELKKSLSLSRSDHMSQLWLCEAIIEYKLHKETATENFNDLLSQVVSDWRKKKIPSGLQRVDDVVRVLLGPNSSEVEVLLSIPLAGKTK